MAPWNGVRAFGSAVRRFFLRLLNRLRFSRAEPELERELASHLTLLADDFERRGMTRQEALRAARLALGGVEQPWSAIATRGRSCGSTSSVGTFPTRCARSAGRRDSPPSWS